MTVDADCPSNEFCGPMTKEMIAEANERLHRPPLGIMPKRFWQLDRQREIVSALSRYLEAGKPLPLDWIEELLRLTQEVAK